MLNPGQDTAHPFAWYQLDGRSSFAVVGGLQKNRISVPVTEEIISQAVHNGNTIVILKSLQDMGMTAYHQISAGVNISFCQ